jgi:hypothetical protein
MPALRLVVSAAALLLLAAAPARAQASEGAPVNRDTAWVRAAVAGACPGGTVRLHLLAGGAAEGRCGPVMDGRLVLRDRAAAERTVQLESVRSVWVQRRQAGRGATQGAIVGAGTVALASILLVKVGCESNDCSRDHGSAMMLGAIFGGAVGFVVGGITGYASKEWERTYP